MSYHMLDITHKKQALRHVIASGALHISSSFAYEGLQTRTLPKGDALHAAEIASLQGIKFTSHLLPLCHPVPIEDVCIEFVFQNPSVFVFVSVRGVAKTGFEMEALMGVQIALLTLYDFLKPLDSKLSIQESSVVYKSGGKSGIVGEMPDFMAKKYTPQSRLKQAVFTGVSCAVITLSDRAFRHEYEDLSGKWLLNALAQEGAQSVGYYLQNDEAPLLKENLLRCVEKSLDVVITTGGTGLAPRDITPDVVRKLSRIDFSELGDYLRFRGFDDTLYAYLSRATAGVIKNTLVVTFPGRLKAVQENFNYLKPMIPHILDMIHDGKHHDSI